MPKPIELDDAVIARFWSKIDKRGPNECWKWQAALNSNGYGHFQIGTLENPRVVRANRVAFILMYGNTDLDVLHSCNTPSCCNPAHLYAGTQAINMKQCVNDGRSSRGEKCGTAKLTEQDVHKIRALYSDGWLQCELAERYKIDQSEVSRICNKKTWSHI